MNTIRYQLGAEELIELGSDGTKIVLKNRKPFLAGRIVRLGASEEENILDSLAAASKFLADKLSLSLITLSKIINVPVGVLSQSPDVAASHISDLVKKVPSMGILLAEILLLGGALVKYGLSTPGLALSGLGNLLSGVASALSGVDGVQAYLDKAHALILDQASEDMKDRIERIFSAVGISADNLTPDVDGNGQPSAPPAGTSFSGAPPPPAPEGNGLGNALAVGVPMMALVTSMAIQ